MLRQRIGFYIIALSAMVAFFKIWDEASQNKHVKKVIGSNITALYSAMSLIYCFAQLLALISASDITRSTGNLLESILVQARIDTQIDFAYLESVQDGGRLRICPDGIAQSVRLEDCPVVFPVQNPRGPITTTAKRDEDFTMLPVFLGNNLTSFMLLDIDSPSNVISLPPVCVRAFEWPYQTLTQTRRSDITVACYQAFLAILSVAAIFCQSIPHAAAAFIMHVLALIWSSSQIAATVNFRSEYRRLITSAAGACDGIDLLASFFKNRLGYVIAAFVLDFVTLLLSAYLTWRLITLYGWKALQKVTSSVLKRAYIIAMSLFAAILLHAFFQVASLAIWLDEVVNHIMGARSTNLAIYMGLYVPLTVTALPWLYLAWSGVRLESRNFVIGFFLFSALYVAGFAGMFASTTFRQTLVYWPFLGAMFTISYVLLLVIIILTSLARSTFGRGLPEYLNASDIGSTNEDIYSTFDSKADVEKAAPSGSATFVLGLPPTRKPKRDASMSSTTSTLNSQRSIGYTKGGQSIVAAQPGSIKILPPVPAAGSTASDTSSSKPSQKSIRLYGKELWGRSRRHESVMSFGHMDPSKLDNPRPSALSPTLRLSLSKPFTIETPNPSRESSAMVQPPPMQGSLPRPQRVDSIGSIYSAQSNRPQLFLVSDLL